MNPAALALAALLLGAPAPSEPPPQPASLGSVFKGLPGDFRRIASRQSAMTLGIAGAASLLAVPKDREITNSLVTSHGLDRTLEAGDVLGDGYVQVGAALGTLAIGHLANRPAIAATGADLLGAQLVNAAITESIKVTARRRRPDGGHFSFPSGHASATFATASVLQRRFGWKVGIPAYILGTYVAASRLQENQHYLSDVVFGAAIGIVAGRVVQIHGRMRNLSASAVPLKGGAAILFMHGAAQ
jgi:membrane-associated phospholipid phosphatase